MLNQKLMGAAAGASAEDPNFKNVTLLLNGDGTNGAQNNTFLDSSTNNFTITRNGNTTQGTFSPYGNLWSNYFDGNGDYLNTSSNTWTQLGTGNFTVEAWCYINSYGTYFPVFDARTGASTNPWAFGVNGSGYADFYAGSGMTRLTDNVAVGLNNWVHIAAVRNGSTVTLYVNGVSKVSTTYSSAINGGTTTPKIGALNDPYYANGYISNARVVIGTAVYTANFTPSTTPLTAVSGTSLLTCQSNRFIDNSSNNFTLTVNGNTSVQRFSPFNPTAAYSASTIGGSGYFDGSGDSLKCNPLGIYNTNFTIEAFIYIAGGSGTRIIATTYNVSPYQANTMIFSIDTSNKVNFGNGLGNATASVASPLNTWIHVAGVYTHSNTTLTLYVNGTSVATYVGAISNESVNGFFIGGSPGDNNLGTAWWNGYISNLRVVKSAVYTGNFTPPTLAPLAATGSASAACYPSTTNVNTSFTNTSLLCNFTNAGVWDAAMMNDLEAVGNARIVTTVKKYNTGSMYFDGTDDRLTFATNPVYAFGTGDFTVEFWMYSNNVSSANQLGILQTSDTVGGLKTTYTTGITIFQGGNASGGALNGGITANVAGTNLGAATASITTGAWYHIALVRSSGTSNLYVNGTSIGSATTTGNCSGQNLVVGGYYSTSFLYNGYIDDLRITKGLARYTTNFTPPTAALPTY